MKKRTHTLENETQKRLIEIFGTYDLDEIKKMVKENEKVIAKFEKQIEDYDNKKD